MGLLTDGWTKRLAVPIQPTQVALANFTAVLTDDMLPAAVTDVLFDTVDGALNNGGDLRASVDVNGDALVGLDLRRWNKVGGIMEAAFLVPSTSSALTTTLYLWWGKDNATQPAAGAVGGQHSAYDDDTIFCAPVGGGANRTAFNITGTDVGGITAGDIAAPSGLLGTQHTDVGDYSTYGDNPDLDLVNTDWTMSFLFRATTSGQEQYILGKYDHTTQNRGYLCIFSAAQHFDLTYQPVRTSYNPIYRLSSGVDVVDGQWHHLAGTFISGTRASVYTDGILRNTTTNNIPSSVASNNTPFQIGTQVTSQNRPADFSQVTVHSVARSAEWLKAENDNLRDSNIFYGTFSEPQFINFNGSVNTSISAPSINSLGLFQLPSFSGTVDISINNPDILSSGIFSLSGISGTSNIEIPTPSISSIGVFVPSEISGSVGVFIDPPSIASLGLFVPPSISGSVNLVTGIPSIDSVGFYVPPNVSGTVSIDLLPPEISSGGFYGTPSYTGVVNLAIGTPTIDSSGVYTPEPITGTASIILTAPLIQSNGLFIEKVFGTSNISIGRPGILASGTFLPPGAIVGEVSINIPVSEISALGNFSEPEILGIIVRALLTKSVIVKAKI
jgi:hypothetical protein